MIDNNKKLPVYKLEIDQDTDDSTGVTIVSLVSLPAIEVDFQMFAKKSEAYPMKFAIQNKERQIISGPIMIADMEIYRKDEMGEYYVIADKDTIYQIVEKFSKTQRGNNVSAEHSGLLLSGVYLMESFIIDSSRGIKAPSGYPNLTDGSWFGSFKVDNPDIWNQVKLGTWKGFSIEGLFGYAKVQMSRRKSQFNMKSYNELINLLNSI